MKKIKIEKKHIDLLLKQINESKKYKDDFSKLLSGEKIYTYSGGRYGTANDYTDEYEFYLKIFNIKYNIDYDSKRMGKSTKYIQVNDKESILLSYNLYNIKGKKLTKNRIKTICNFYNITNYSINDDMTIDVDGDVRLFRKKLTELPLNFNKVSGKFYCGNNNLTTLKGCPKYIGNNCDLQSNNLTTLEFAPEYVGGNFNCQYNNINSYDGLGEVAGSVNSFIPYDYQIFRRENTINSIIN